MDEIKLSYRSLAVGSTISLDYWWSLRKVPEDSENYETVMKEIHQRSAERLVDGCLDNGGLYIKLGNRQFNGRFWRRELLTRTRFLCFRTRSGVDESHFAQRIYRNTESATGQMSG